jgi:hypothetical protein
MKVVGLVVAGLALGLFAGCPAVECNADADCSGGKVCKDRKCADPDNTGSSSSSGGGGSSTVGSSSAAGSSSRAGSSSLVAQSSSAVVNSSSTATNSSSVVVVGSSSAGQSSSAGGNSSSGGMGGLRLEEGHLGTVGDARLVGGSSGQYVLTEMGFEGLGTTCAASLCVTGGITP